MPAIYRLDKSPWRFARFGQDPVQQDHVIPEPAGLAEASYDDSGWRCLELPHDWGVEGPFRTDLPNDTAKLPWVGIGWYRLEIPQDIVVDDNQRLFLDIDGAMAHSTIYLNGIQVGGWAYGYSPFCMELTKAWLQDSANVLAIRLDNKPLSSRWYPGAGLYRSIQLRLTPPATISADEIAITTPAISPTQADVQVRYDPNGMVRLPDAARLQHEIVNSQGDSVANVTCLATTAAKLQIDQPQLWDLATPHLYTLRTTLDIHGTAVDVITSTFGIRDIKLTADQGLQLNGKRVPIQGVCLHHDLGPLGAAFYPAAFRRQLTLLQEMGCNAIRTAHNPPAREVCRLCDEMGILVMSETFDCWAAGKQANDYGSYFHEWWQRDVAALIRRDRNCPSVFLWSSGNEILEQSFAHGPEFSVMLKQFMKTIDPTRPVTVGFNVPESHDNGMEKTVDAFGFNYKPYLYEKFFNENPTIPFYGSETSSCVSTRGYYHFPLSYEKGDGCDQFQVTSYDVAAPPWAFRPDVEFEGIDRNPTCLGEFVWTGFDYLGEPTPFNNDRTNLFNFSKEEDRQAYLLELERIGGTPPSRSSYFGIMDLCGFKKDRFFLYQARWRADEPMAHILPHWNWPDRVGETTPVHVYTSGDSAELFLNGHSLGVRTKDPYTYRLCWDDVPYEAGDLRVHVSRNGKPWCEAQRQTTGTASAIELTHQVFTGLDETTDDRLLYITASIVDTGGALVPNAQQHLTWTVEGPATLLAIDNGDPTEHHGFHATDYPAFNGLCLAILAIDRSKSDAIRISVRADGLDTASLTLNIA